METDLQLFFQDFMAGYLWKLLLFWRGKDFFFVKMSEFPENRTKALDFF
ncbi:hypothetical protein [Ruminococcus callidus]|jgi:hypothetical protein|nr:hypothetical protein [Ruminococcus callidus]